MQTSSKPSAHPYITDTIGFSATSHHDAILYAAEQISHFRQCQQVCVFDYTCSFRLAWGKLLSVLSGAVRDITTTHTYTLTSTCGNSSELPNPRAPPSDSPLCERQAHFPTQWLASRLREPARSIEPLANACAHILTHAQTHSMVIPSLTNTQPILTEPRLCGKVY